MLRLALAAIALVAVAAGLAAVSEGDPPAAAVSATGGGEIAFGQPPPPTLPAPLPLPTTSVEAESAIVKSPPRLVTIPAIDVEATVIDLGLEDDGSLETPQDYDLAGWWAGGTTALEPGPAVIVGHVDDYTGPAVFYRLRELDVGDEIEVTDSTGAVSRFVVTDTGVYDKDDFPTQEVYGPTDGPTLRLITCGGAFDRSARSYEDNVVVYAELH
ncbi:MAG: class F sortase [Acidimicrobiales bacterium]